MKKIKLLIIVDTIAFIFFILSLFSGIVMQFILPKGAGQSGLDFLGLARHNWSDVHLYSGIIFGIAVFIHLLLHWGWIKSIFKLWKSQ